MKGLKSYATFPLKKIKRAGKLLITHHVPEPHKNYCGKPGTRSESIVRFFSFLSTPKYEDKNGKLDFGDKDNKLDHLVTWLKLGIKKQ